MKTKKVSLVNIKDKLSRAEMKNIMAGAALVAPSCSGSCDFTWTDSNGDKHTTPGTCKTTTGGYCYCSNGEGSCSA